MTTRRSNLDVAVVSPVATTEPSGKLHYMCNLRLVFGEPLRETLPLENEVIELRGQPAGRPRWTLAKRNRIAVCIVVAPHRRQEVSRVSDVNKLSERVIEYAERASAMADAAQGKKRIRSTGGGALADASGGWRRLVRDGEE